MKALEDISLKELIPQRPPFVLIDRLLEYDDTCAVSELTVRSDNVFIENDSLLAAGLVENIAQTCAARIGYYCLINDLPVNIGLIGAISNLEIIRSPRVGERIVTTIEVLEEMLQITLVKAVVKSGTEELAFANMKIALTEIGSKD